MDVQIPATLPLIPIYNNRVPLPGIIIKFEVDRLDSIDYFSKHNLVALVPCIFNQDQLQNSKNSRKLFISRADQDVNREITECDLFEFGTVCRVVEFKKNSHLSIVTLEALIRFRRVSISEMHVSLETYEEVEADGQNTEMNESIKLFLGNCRELMQELNKSRLPAAFLKKIDEMLQSSSIGKLCDLIASLIDLSYNEKLEVLASYNLQTFQVSKQITSSAIDKLSAKQREALLRQQLSVIKKELGEGNGDDESEIEELVEKIKNLDLSIEARKICDRELSRLKRMNPAMSEYQVIRNYLDWINDLPWNISSASPIDIKHATKILNDDHHGLEKIKKRIIEYLAIRRLKNDIKGPILCLLGPPGVGKTSLGKSIANALGRKFYRIALGGVRDESEIRGHRRTYIGSMPGLIIHALKRCGVDNPVILLDEIDKLGKDSRGDPSAALLEVLDPEQNVYFTDHYMNVAFDLSKVLFIATANDGQGIPAALMDRMELIQMNGYSVEEKLSIARIHLVPKQINAHGLPLNVIQISDDVLDIVITKYTREAGVRNLEREIGSLCRFLAVDYAENLDGNTIHHFNGKISAFKPAYYESEVAGHERVCGVVTGLAWTSSGSGDILFIEASESPGKGLLKLTGPKIFIRKVGIRDTRVGSNRIFICSSKFSKTFCAGVTITIALISLLGGKSVDSYTAMTGEITLRGLVLPVGGIKEKILAAHRAGIKRVIIPSKNRKDLIDISLTILEQISVKCCSTIDEYSAILGLGENLTDARL